MPVIHTTYLLQHAGRGGQRLGDTVSADGF